MKPINEELYRKIDRVTSEVRENFRRRGLVIPVENKDGSITLENFTIVRQGTGFYAILNRNGEAVVEQINLPQTAALLANGLALGRFLDNELLTKDRNYGYALFDETLHERAVQRSNKKPLDYFDLRLSKCMIARAKKEQYKNDIVKSFEKLQKLI
jgi:hypothetical protein